MRLGEKFPQASSALLLLSFFCHAFAIKHPSLLFSLSLFQVFVNFAREQHAEEGYENPVDTSDEIPLQSGMTLQEEKF